MAAKRGTPLARRRGTPGRKPAGSGTAAAPVRRAPRSADARLESTLTARLQTTVPSGVRKALGVGPGDRVEYIIHGEQAVIRKAAASDVADPAIGAFLTLLARDLGNVPTRVGSIPTALLKRMRAMTAAVRIDHDELLDGAIAI